MADQEKIKLNSKLQFWGRISNGKLILNSPTWLATRLLKYQDCPVELKIERVRSIRTLAQNALYWGSWLPVISDSTGHSTQELHEFYKKMFLPKKVIVLNKKEMVIDDSTTNLNIAEFSDYLMKIQAEVAQMGIVLPCSEEYNK